MASQRQLKSKIRSVTNIKQITRAMQMVAATKMRRSQEAALSARPYAKKAFSLLLHLLQHGAAEGISSKYWQAKHENPTAGGRKVALVVVTSDKGLAGSFNSGVLRLAARWKEEAERDGRTVEIVAVGKKGRDYFKTRGAAMTAEFFQYSDVLTLADVDPLMDWVIKAYEDGMYEKVVFCSTHFVSALVQRPEVSQILPLERKELESIIEGIVPKTGRYSELAAAEEKVGGAVPYVLEPSTEAVLERVVRDLVRVAMLHLIFESNASEHSARMMAMKNATENAERVQEELTLALNKSRQAAITQELTEIATAKEALTSE